MPYPDGDYGMGIPAQQEEELSGTEKHWNQVCLGIATIATALLGATLLIAGFTEQDRGDHGQSEVLKALFTLLAAALYLNHAPKLGQGHLPKPPTGQKDQAGTSEEMGFLNVLHVRGAGGHHGNSRTVNSLSMVPGTAWE